MFGRTIYTLRGLYTTVGSVVVRESVCPVWSLTSQLSTSEFSNAVMFFIPGGRADIPFNL